MAVADIQFKNRRVMRSAHNSALPCSLRQTVLRQPLKVCGQIQAYMGWIKENLARNCKVRGIIVANKFSNKLIYAVKASPDIALMRYQVNFTLTEV